MELVNLYRKLAYRNFEYYPLCHNLRTEKQQVADYLQSSQKGQDTVYRFSMRDIETVLSQEALGTPLDGLNVKVVLQKANFDVKESTKANGYTTRLLFLTKDTYGNGDWYLYGRAKGLYNDLTQLSISKEEPLGWTLYISLMEADGALSGGLSRLETMSPEIASVLARLYERKNR